MSAEATINTATGNHPVDPYKSKNLQDPPLPQKIEDLVDFISEVKFGMLTTKQSDGEFLTSRCMALAAKVSYLCMEFMEQFAAAISRESHRTNCK